MKTRLEELPFWIAFSHVRGIGPVRFRKLLEFFGSVKEAFYASEKALEEAVGKVAASLIIEARQNLQPESLYEEVERENLQVLTIEDEAYPALLKNTYRPPFLLYLKGSFDFSRFERYLAIVGTRNPTPYGRKVAQVLSRDLSEYFVIVSGLALGIDGEAHRAVVEKGGITIGVLGNGLRRVYPATHFRLACEIIEKGGALLSEYPPSWEPCPENFPPRNRIISGLSQGVVVVEAPRRSGAMITASFALEEGREVMAVPGPVFSPQSEGTNALIAQGARLVQSAQDVCEALGLLWKKREETLEKNELGEKEKHLFSLIDYQGKFKEELLEQVSWPEGEFFQTLLALEMKGLIQEVWGGKVVRV
ncbi:MAG: DNA-processing protein DprA [Atribacterota bacterium]|nr:DNA-processing protein DprA [Atribacterota bacterium]